MIFLVELVNLKDEYKMMCNILGVNVGVFSCLSIIDAILACDALAVATC